MKVLGLSTSTPRGSAAVLVDGAIAGRRSYEGQEAHAERIFEAIEGALADAKIDRRDLDAIACDVGPGSFTGVRVGVASANGIALGLGVPAVGVGSLEAVAEEVFHERAYGGRGQGIVGAALDAKRGELYAAFYDRTGAALVEPRLVPATPDGIAVLLDALGSLGRRRTLLAVGEWPGGSHPSYPSAASVARIGALRLQAPGRSAAGWRAIEPVYVRPPDAKLPPTR